MKKQNNTEKPLQEFPVLSLMSTDVLNDRLQRIPQSIETHNELMWLRKQLKISAERRHDNLMEQVAIIRAELAKHASVILEYQKQVINLHTEQETIANILKERQNEN
jgi:hypothetical protein